MSHSPFLGSFFDPPDPFLLLQGLRFEVVPSKFKEKLDKASFATPYGYAMETAKQKALEVANRMHQARGPCSLALMKIPLL